MVILIVDHQVRAIQHQGVLVAFVVSADGNAHRSGIHRKDRIQILGVIIVFRACAVPSTHVIHTRPNGSPIVCGCAAVCLRGLVRIRSGSVGVILVSVRYGSAIGVLRIVGTVCVGNGKTLCRLIVGEGVVGQAQSGDVRLGNGCRGLHSGVALACARGRHALLFAAGDGAKRIVKVITTIFHHVLVKEDVSGVSTRGYTGVLQVAHVTGSTATRITIHAPRGTIRCALGADSTVLRGSPGAVITRGRCPVTIGAEGYALTADDAGKLVKDNVLSALQTGGGTVSGHVVVISGRIGRHRNVHGGGINGPRSGRVHIHHIVAVVNGGDARGIGARVGRSGGAAVSGARRTSQSTRVRIRADGYAVTTHDTRRNSCGCAALRVAVIHALLGGRPGDGKGLGRDAPFLGSAIGCYTIGGGVCRIAAHHLRVIGACRRFLCVAERSAVGAVRNKAHRAHRRITVIISQACIVVSCRGGRFHLVSASAVSGGELTRAEAIELPSKYGQVLLAHGVSKRTLGILIVAAGTPSIVGESIAVHRNTGALRAVGVKEQLAAAAYAGNIVSARLVGSRVGETAVIEAHRIVRGKGSGIHVIRTAE